MWRGSEWQRGARMHKCVDACTSMGHKHQTTRHSCTSRADQAALAAGCSRFAALYPCATQSTTALCAVKLHQLWPSACSADAHKHSFCVLFILHPTPVCHACLSPQQVWSTEQLLCIVHCNSSAIRVASSSAIMSNLAGGRVCLGACNCMDPMSCETALACQGAALQLASIPFSCTYATAVQVVMHTGLPCATGSRCYTTSICSGEAAL
jgi:hypothetical protein